MSGERSPPLPCGVLAPVSGGESVTTGTGCRMIYIFHAKGAESAKILSPFLFTLALEWSQTSLRQESAESLSTPSPLRVLPPVSGGESERVRFNDEG